MSDIGNINAIREWSRRYFYTKEDINYFVTKLNEGYKGYALTFVGPRNTKVVINPEHYEFLKDAGCEKVQGFLFGKPMPIDECTENCIKLGLTFEKDKSH